MSAVVESVGVALVDLVEALRATNWSSWQTTARFDPALHAAEAAIAHERIRDAAPELLEALQAIVADNEFCGDTWGDRRNAWIATACAAISKATGEQA